MYTKFPVFRLAQKDTASPHHPSAIIYGRFNYDMVNERAMTRAITIKSKPKDKQLAHFL